jgi:hypothetical protein
MEERRKTHTSSTVKNRYNKKNYKQVATQVKPEVADRIQAYRTREGISMAQFLSRAIEVLEAE